MIIFTKGNETLGSLVHDILGYNDESYGKKIIAANRNSINGAQYIEQGYFWPNRALWLPEISRLDNDPDIRDIILHRCDFIPSWGRANLVKLQKHRVNINHLIGVGKCIRQHNRVNYADGKGIAASLGAQATAESMFRLGERAAKPAEQFTNQMKRLNTQLKNLVALRKAGKSAEEIQSARTAYQATYKETQYALNHGAKLYAKRLSHKATKYLMSAKHSESIAYKKGIFIDALDDVKMLARIARYGKWAGRGFYMFSALLGIDEVFDTYEEGGDWEATAVGVGSEMAIIMGLGQIMLLFTPAGWVTTVAIAIGEGLLYTKMGNSIKTWTENWFKTNVEHWL